jgi:hypothetical protein
MKRFFFILAIFGIVLFACQKSADNTGQVSEDQLKQETIETGLCFNFVYPIIVEFRDGTTTRVQDNIQYRRLLASCGGEQCFGFVYPLSVTFRGGNTVMVENDQQMRRVYAACD